VKKATAPTDAHVAHHSHGFSASVPAVSRWAVANPYRA
jgi:hypothetical protein